MDFPKLPYMQQSWLQTLCDMYYRQSRDYFAKIQQNEQQIKQTGLQLLKTYRQKVVDQKEDNEDSLEYQAKYRDQQDQYKLNKKQLLQHSPWPNCFAELDKQVHQLQQQIQIFIFAEKRNFERAKQEEPLSSQLARMTAQKVGEIAGYRYAKFECLFEQFEWNRQQQVSQRRKFIKKC